MELFLTMDSVSILVQVPSIRINRLEYVQILAQMDCGPIPQPTDVLGIARLDGSDSPQVPILDSAYKR